MSCYNCLILSLTSFLLDLVLLTRRFLLFTPVPAALPLPPVADDDLLLWPFLRFTVGKGISFKNPGRVCVSVCVCVCFFFTCPASSTGWNAGCEVPYVHSCVESSHHCVDSLIQPGGLWHQKAGGDLRPEVHCITLLLSTVYLDMLYLT